MAWELQFDGALNYALLDTEIDFGIDEFKITINCNFDLVPAADINTLISSSTVTNEYLYYRVSTAQWVLVMGGSSRTINMLNTDVLGKAVVAEINRDATGAWWFVINGISSSIFTSIRSFKLGQIARRLNSTWYFGGRISAILVNRLSLDVNNFDATGSDHSTGTLVLSDVLSGNNATGISMPTDGSAWINLDPFSADLTGTAVPTQTESDIVTGGKTIIITLTGDTFVTVGATFDAQRQAIINGLTSAQSELTGWNSEVRDKEVVTSVVRTSDTVCTITLSASALYDITATETITSTIPNAALVTSTSDIISTPTFTVSAALSGFQPAWAIGANTLIN